MDHRENVRSTIAGVMHDIDARRWPELQARLAPEVETDYTSLFGGAPVTQDAGALVVGWKGALSRVATQHLLGPIEVQVEGDRALAGCHVRALHLAPGAPGGELWEVLGHYRFELRRSEAGWRIARMALDTFLQTGNGKLLQEAGG